MTKVNGLGDGLLLQGYDLSGDIGSLGNIHGGCAVQDVTGIDKYGFERIAGLFDGGIDYSAFFNDSTGRSHAVLSQIPATSGIVIYLRGRTLGGQAACLSAKRVDYPWKRGNDGALTMDVASQAADGLGLEWTVQLTPGIRTDTAPTNGPTLDYGSTVGATTHGLSAYLQILGLVGTSVTVKVQHSVDGTTWTDLAAFAAASAVGAQRVSTSGTVNRYLRAVTSGTFSSAVFVVAAEKRTAAPAW